MVESVPSRKEEILDRALELVRETGLGGLRIRHLAARVGVTEGALYRHFPSKEAILLALAERVAERLLTPIRTLAARRDLSPHQRLERVVRHHVDVLLATDALPVLLVAEASSSEHATLRARMAATLASYLAILEALLVEMGRTDELEPRELALLVLGLPAGLAIRHRILPDPALEERARGELVTHYLRRLLPAER